jgi:hypothetical protein
MVAIGIFPYKGKIPTAEPEIEAGTSWLVVRSSDHQATRLITLYLSGIHQQHSKQHASCYNRYILFIFFIRCQNYTFGREDRVV